MTPHQFEPPKCRMFVVFDGVKACIHWIFTFLQKTWLPFRGSLHTKIPNYRKKIIKTQFLCFFTLNTSFCKKNMIFWKTCYHTWETLWKVRKNIEKTMLNMSIHTLKHVFWKNKKSFLPCVHDIKIIKKCKKTSFLYFFSFLVHFGDFTLLTGVLFLNFLCFPQNSSGTVVQFLRFM